MLIPCIFPRFVIPGIVVTFALCGCATTQKYSWSQSLLRDHISSLRESCNVTAQSGFTADLSVSEQGTSRMDAAWDSHGNLNGQVVNPLGEDLLNFKIDSTGVLQTDVSIRQSAILGTALEFLAELGTQRTRQLLCSGLFLSGTDQLGQGYGHETSELEFTLNARGSQWHVKSNLYPIMQGETVKSDEVRIITQVTTAEWLFRQSIASIEWRGKKIGRFIRPQQLYIRSSRASVRLSFLDFD